MINFISHIITLGNASLLHHECTCCVFSERSAYTDYVPEVQHYALPLMITVISFIIPLLFTIVLHIDTKYSAKEFVRLFLTSCSSVCLYACILICFAVWFAFAMNQHCMLLAIALCISVTLLFCSAIWSFATALKFNNPQKLLDSILKKYKNRYVGLCANQQLKQFYSLNTHLFNYAIKKDINFLYTIQKEFIEKHLIVWNEKYRSTSYDKSTYEQYLYDLIVHVAIEYKENLDDVEISKILAILYFSLLDINRNVSTGQETYDALFQTLYLCINNNHESLINEFQRLMRYAYRELKNENKTDEACRLRIFMLVLNATLYGKGKLNCVNTAIQHNFDSEMFDINKVILPLTTAEALDVYFWITTVLWADKQYSYYTFVTSDFTSSNNITTLHQYLDSYFAYLALTHYRSGAENAAVKWCVNLDINSIRRGFKRLEYVKENVKNVINKSSFPDNLFASLETNTYQHIIDRFSSEATHPASYLQIVKQDITTKDIPSTLKNIATFEDRDIRNVMTGLISVPNLALIIPRSQLIPAYINYSNTRIGSRIIEHFTNVLADVYKSFERIEEQISVDQLSSRWLDYMCKDDYCFLSVGVAPRLTIHPVMGEFSSYFPSRCIIVIRRVDLPIIKWDSNQTNITSLEDLTTEGTNDNSTIQLPQCILKLDLHASISYNKSATIHVLKISNNKQSL